LKAPGFILARGRLALDYADRMLKMDGRQIFAAGVEQAQRRSHQRQRHFGRSIINGCLLCHAVPIREDARVTGPVRET
jgi:hypothetical protein